MWRVMWCICARCALQVVILLLMVIVGVGFFVAYKHKKRKQEEEQNGRRTKPSTKGKGKSTKATARYSPPYHTPAAWHCSGADDVVPFCFAQSPSRCRLSLFQSCAVHVVPFCTIFLSLFYHD